MANRVLWKLIRVNSLLVVLVLLSNWLALDYLAAGYFADLFQDYGISPTDAHDMFLSAAHRYLIEAGLFALLIISAISFFGTRTVVGPLHRMTEVTREFARGDYRTRIDVRTGDEVGQLAAAFNEMAEKLQRDQMLRKTMVLNVAHELRIPLTNMRGYLEALSEGVVDPSAATFRLLQEETFRLIKLVEDLLRLARADAARTTARREPVNLSYLIAQVADLFKVRFDAKAISLDTSGVDAGVYVTGDAEKLIQVLTNLFENAWSYSPPGGNVLVSVERQAGTCKATFTNDGEGIAPEDLPFVFELFYRGEKSRSREHGGAGIGLAIVKELIEAHAGAVGSDSFPGRTRIWFTLPV